MSEYYLMPKPADASTLKNLKKQYGPHYHCVSNDLQSVQFVQRRGHFDHAIIVEAVRGAQNEIISHQIIDAVEA